MDETSTGTWRVAQEMGGLCLAVGEICLRMMLMIKQTKVKTESILV